eukprot:GHVN01027646.1.p1 GENE.GHVN01027646.1~~GHVN01027646.1.p1  ORF type:complete len:110 (+),score=14.20 GHVN01027646.1:211-540(+)
MLAFLKDVCDPNSAFFGFMGITAACVFSNLGSAYGTAKSGVGITSMGVMRPELVMRSVIPVVMAGVLGIYGIIISMMIVAGHECECLQLCLTRELNPLPSTPMHISRLA